MRFSQRTTFAHWLMSTRQVAVRLDPLRVHHADDHFGGRPDREPLGRAFRRRPGHPGDLGREPLDVLGLAHQQRLRNQQREIGVLVAGRLEARVELGLEPLPQPVPVGTQDEASAHGRLRDQLRSITDGLVPLRQIGGFGRDFTDEFGHDQARF